MSSVSARGPGAPLGPAKAAGARNRSPQRVLWGALLATAGCVQVLGLHDRSEVTADAGSTDSLFDASASGSALEAGHAEAAMLSLSVGQCGQLLHPSSACASCMDHACCDQSKACAGDVACREASDCLAGCTDAACRARCQAFYALPDTLIGLRSCRVRQCASACASSCGESASGISSCQACEQASCCSQGATCASNAACSALSLCVSNCFGAASCPNDCQTKYPMGAADYGGLLSCSSQCGTMCQPGQSWGCLDSPIIWPKPKGVGSITFSVTFVDFSAEQPFVGATVKACNKLDLACAAPLAQSVTDATGLVSLTVSVGLSGFDGYLDVTGGKVAGTGAPAFPAIWYPVPFVVADGWRGRSQLLAVDEFLGLAMATGATLDPTRGHFALNAVDCAFSPAAGVTFSIDIGDPKTVGYYLVGGVPTTTAISTDASGVGVFLNLPTSLPARIAVVKAFSSAAGGKVMGSLSVIIRPGTLTTGSSYPPVPP